MTTMETDKVLFFPMANDPVVFRVKAANGRMSVVAERTFAAYKCGICGDVITCAQDDLPLLDHARTHFQSKPSFSFASFVPGKSST